MCTVQKNSHIFYLDRSKKFGISYNSSQPFHPSQYISAHKTEYYGKFISRSSIFKCIIFLKFNSSLFIFCLDELLNICMGTYALYIWYTQAYIYMHKLIFTEYQEISQDGTVYNYPRLYSHVIKILMFYKIKMIY